MVLNGKKILIVEDEKFIAKALELKLKSAGFEVVVAHTGERGFSLLLKNKFDLVVLDLILPKMDGFKFLEKINGRKIKTKVVVASNLNQPEDRARAKDLGAKDFFVKSGITIAEFVRRIQEITEVT